MLRHFSIRIAACSHSPCAKMNPYAQPQPSTRSVFSYTKNYSPSSSRWVVVEGPNLQEISPPLGLAHSTPPGLVVGRPNFLQLPPATQTNLLLYVARSHTACSDAKLHTLVSPATLQPFSLVSVAVMYAPLTIKANITIRQRDPRMRQPARDPAERAAAPRWRAG